MTLMFPFALLCFSAAPRPGGSGKLWPIQVTLHADAVQRPHLLPGAAVPALPAQPPPEELEGTAVC